MKDTLVLSGGGLLGICTLGALNVLFQEYDQKYFKNIIGTSVGALIASMLCVKKPHELYEIIQNMNIFSNDNVDFSEYFENYGFVKHDVILEILEMYIPRPMTMLEFYHETKIHLVLVGTNLTNGCSEYFDYINTPSMKLFDAISISISVPFVFYQIKYNNCIYSDGSITDDFPWNYFNTCSSHRLGIKLYSVQQYEDTGFLHYIHTLVNTLINNQRLCDNQNILSLYIDFPILKEYTTDDLSTLYSFGKTEALGWLKKNK